MKIKGVYLESPETYDYENEMVIRLTDPTFTVHQDDLNFEVKEGENVEIRSKKYKVREVNPLGHGRIELRLVSGKS